ncbi:MAG: hypothetical protein PHV82_17585 [Victivallaceae bacterium]|nr:hypothetical protein [Victivallaceae bacterium]
MLQRINANDRVDELIINMADNMEVDDIPVLSQAVCDTEKALQLLDSEKDRIGYLRGLYLLHTIRICLYMSDEPTYEREPRIG